MGSSPIFAKVANWTYDHETRGLDGHWWKNWKKKAFSKISSRRSSKLTPKNPFFSGGPFLGPQCNISYLGFPSSVLGHSKHVGPGNGLSGHLFSFLWPFVTIQYQCDTSRDVIWCHDFGPTAPLRRQNLKTLYLDFPRSLIIVPKHSGPRYTLYGSINSISRPPVTIQCRCYTWRDVIWCHDFGSTAP